jgi:hypothetical protein
MAMTIKTSFPLIFFVFYGNYWYITLWFVSVKGEGEEEEEGGTERGDKLRSGEREKQLKGLYLEKDRKR